ncbi:MAG: hypothetical protein ACI4DO_08325 [Roseburia sp.]
MKIKVVIAEKDESYTSKLINNLVGRYAEQLEICSFTEEELLIQFLKEKNTDVVLVSTEFEGIAPDANSKMAFAYLTDYKTEEVDGVAAVCKYQKVENIYKSILSLYSELGKNYINYGGKTDGTKVISFLGVGGGVGTSTMAAAYAEYLAGTGKKTIYLNLEKLASTKAFFQAEGKTAFDEVLFALKSKKMNLGLKIESSIRCDNTGVFFFEACKNCMDILELKEDDIKCLIEGICGMSQYDYLIIDSDFALDSKMNQICNMADKIILVSNGTYVNNLKMELYIQSIHSIEERNKIAMQPKLQVVYNKFRNKESKVVEISDLKNVGGVPLLEKASPSEMARHIARMEFWKMVEE